MDTSHSCDLSEFGSEHEYGLQRYSMDQCVPFGDEIDKYDSDEEDWL